MAEIITTEELLRNTPKIVTTEELFASEQPQADTSQKVAQQPAKQDIYDEMGLPVGKPSHMATAINLPFIPLQALLRSPGTLTAEDPGQGVGEPGTSILDVAGLAGKAAATALPGGYSPEGGDYNLTPEFGAEIAKTVVELGAYHPYTKAMGGLFGAATKGMEMLVARYGKTTASIDTAISKAVKEGMTKGVKYKVKGKGDAGKVSKYLEKSENAVLNIIENSEGVLPKTATDFSEAIYKTKKVEHNISSTMATEAGLEGAGVSLLEMRNDLNAIIDQPNVLQSTKDASQNVLKEIQHFDDVISPSQAEDILSAFNAKNNSFWNKPNFNAASEAVTRERFSIQLRKATDKAISEYRGPGWQESRNRYGSLRHIEKEVTDRATVDLRKNIKGFFDLADIASASEFALGLTRMDPSLIVSGTATQGVKRWIKHLNNPNRYIKNMFSAVNRHKNTKNNILLREAAKAGDVSAEIDAAQLLIGYNPVFSRTRMEMGVLKSQVWREQYPGTAAIPVGAGKHGMPLIKPSGLIGKSTVPKALKPNITNAFEPTPEEFANIVNQAKAAKVKARPRTATSIIGEQKVDIFQDRSGIKVRHSKPMTIDAIKTRRLKKATKTINDLRKKKGLKPFKTSAILRALKHIMV